MLKISLFHLSSYNKNANWKGTALEIKKNESNHLILLDISTSQIRRNNIYQANILDKLKSSNQLNVKHKIFSRIGSSRWVGGLIFSCSVHLQQHQLRCKWNKVEWLSRRCAFHQIAVGKTEKTTTFLTINTYIKQNSGG